MRKAVTSIVIFLLAAAPFAAAVRYGVIDCDDYQYVKDLDWVVAGLGGERLMEKAFTDVGNAIWMPLTWISYAADYEISGLIGIDPFGLMHTVSILVHALNAVLVYWLLSILGCGGKCRLAPVFAALVWAIHPLRVESVVWIASRKDVLSMFWLLLSLISWKKWRIGNGKALYAASMVFLICGAMCKPSVMVFPVLCFLTDWIAGRIPRNITDLRSPDFWGREEIRWIAGYVVPALISGMVGYSAMVVQSIGGATEELSVVPLWWRLLNAVTSLGIYLFHTLWPVDLCIQPQCRYPGLPRLVFVGTAASAMLLFAVWRYWKRVKAADNEHDRMVLCGLLWFVISLVPFLGLANFGEHAFADRFTYIPALGLSIVLSVIIGGLYNVLPRSCWACAIIGICGLFGVATWRQTGHWKDSFTIWSRTLEVDGPINHNAVMSCAEHYFDVPHNLDKAVMYFERLWEIKPKRAGGIADFHVMALCELGKRVEAWKVLQKYREWVDWYLKEMARKGHVPMQSFYQYDLARCVYFMGDKGLVKIAEEEIARLEKIMPPRKDLLYVKGLLFRHLGDEQKAQDCWRKIDTVKSGEKMTFEFVKKLLPGNQVL